MIFLAPTRRKTWKTFYLANEHAKKRLFVSPCSLETLGSFWNGLGEASLGGHTKHLPWGRRYFASLSWGMGCSVYHMWLFPYCLCLLSPGCSCHMLKIYITLSTAKAIKCLVFPLPQVWYFGAKGLTCTPPLLICLPRVLSLV